jgi:transcriptional regulator of arginine metabolism
MPRSESPLTESLKELVRSGLYGTQDEICDELKKLGHNVTQSTVSRGLRRLGAVRAIDTDGKTIYRLGEESAPLMRASLKELVLDIASNGSIIVMHTTPGSASLVARHLDHARPGDLLGTIAGDDTIFVAPSSVQKLQKTITAIEDSLREQNA